MSHITEVKLDVKDLDALADAARALGGELNRGQETFSAYFGTNPCSHAISFPHTSYEVGVIERGDGEGYTLKCDWFSTGKLGQVCGENGEKLSQEYAASVAWRHYSQQGFSVQRTVTESGEIVLEATK